MLFRSVRDGWTRCPDRSGCDVDVRDLGANKLDTGPKKVANVPCNPLRPSSARHDPEEGWCERVLHLPFDDGDQMLIRNPAPQLIGHDLSADSATEDDNVFEAGRHDAYPLVQNVMTLSDSARCPDQSAGAGTANTGTGALQITG